MPGEGLGYAALEHLRPSRDAALPRAEVVFNYLGRLDRVLPQDSPFGPSDLSAGPTRAPGQPRSHLLEVTAAVEGERLVVNWGYATSHHDEATLEALAQATLEGLENLVAGRDGGDGQGLAPSDFPEAALNEDRLADVLEELDLG